MLKLDRRGGLLFADIELPFKNTDKLEAPIPFVLDTGAAVTIVDPGITDYLGYSTRDAIKISKLDGAGGYSEGYVLKLSKIRCLNIEIPEFEIACHDLNSRLGVAGLLGMNFLKCLRIDIDFETGRIHKITQK
ncbi:MAG: clan AA aspartic protease [Oligoflexia bacterium]|nr:clan AA aspartic protease [Oligoflexia bacterium]